MAGVTHTTAATGTDSGDGKISKNAWNEGHTVVWGEKDVILDIFGSPTSSFEFNTSSLSGLTALSPTPDSEDANTTIPGHYYIKDNASGVARCGRYFSPGSTPWTAIMKISDAGIRFDYNQVGLFVGEATPGTMNTIQLAAAVRRIETEVQTPTSFVGSIGNASGSTEPPIYFAIVANSGTDVDFLYSHNGYTWMMHTEARNPSFTIGSVGFMVAANNTNGVSAAIDHIRLWNSAKTFPGVY